MKYFVWSGFHPISFERDTTSLYRFCREDVLTTRITGACIEIKNCASGKGGKYGAVLCGHNYSVRIFPFINWEFLHKHCHDSGTTGR